MMRVILILILFSKTPPLVAQSLLAQFHKLSRPEKCWTIFHPLVATCAFNETKRAQVVTDSIKKSGVIGTDNSGGKLDAFKHAYWIASVAVSIGSKKALKLGRAHEKGNELQFKKHQLEDQLLPDSISSAMDLCNNLQGATAVKNQRHLAAYQVQDKIMSLLKNGQLCCIKKDAMGNFLSCDGKLIQLEQWKGHWYIPKCLIASNEN